MGISEDLLNALSPSDRETWEERAAIAEFDGGLTREEAEALAWQTIGLQPVKKP